MARIVADRGVQMYQVPRTVDPRGGTMRYHEFDLDCSCTLRVDELYLSNVGRMDLMSRIERVADAHICAIEVFAVQTEAAKRRRAEYASAQQRERVLRTNVDPPLRYMGVDVSLQSDETWLTMWGSEVRAPEQWQREILGSFRADVPRRRSPAEVEASMRESPAPRQAPEEAVRAAAQLRGESLTTIIMDEVGPVAAAFDHARPVGFQPAPVQRAVTMTGVKKQEDQPRPDRFLLIELD